MSSSTVRQPKLSAARPTFEALVQLRTEWRDYHERQDRENADRVFREAGIAAVTDGELKFFPAVFRAKLNEFGRDWERTLAAQALREGFSFYRVQLRMEVGSASKFHDWIHAQFARSGMATGTPLFFESNGLQALQDGLWDSLFYFVLRPELDVETLGLTDAPGIIGPAKALRIA